MAFNPSQVTLRTGAVIIWGGSIISGGDGGSVLLINPDSANTMYIGGGSNIAIGAPNTIPLGPGQSIQIDGSNTIYACAPAGTSPIVIIPGGAAFFLGLTQGQGKLALSAMQSPNFVSGVSGWQLTKNGNLEANSATIRNGEIISGTQLYYSGGTPAAGTLILSISATSGTDSAGNAYIGGGAATYFYSGTTPLFAALLAGVELAFFHWSGTAWTSLNAQVGIQGNVLNIDSNNGISIAGSLLSVFSGLAVTGGTTTDTLDVTGASTLSGVVTATGGTPANPTKITTDTWQPINVFSNGWSATAGVSQRYRTQPFVGVWLDVVITPGTLTDFTLMFNVPALYRPLTTKFVTASTAGGTAITNGPAARIDAGGNVECVGLPAGCTQMRINGFYPLD